MKDVQGLSATSCAATTTDVYMQEIPKSVQATVDSINPKLRRKPTSVRKRKASGERGLTASQLWKKSERFDTK